MECSIKEKMMNEFLEELATLFEKYNVDLSVEMSGGYDEYPTGIAISTNAVWDDEGNLLQPWTEVISGYNGIEASDIRNLIGTGVLK